MTLEEGTTLLLRPGLLAGAEDDFDSTAAVEVGPSETTAEELATCELPCFWSCVDVV